MSAFYPFMFFIYGLSFFTLGAAILLYPRRNSKFRLAASIGLIGLFGVFHGITEWLDMFIFIHPGAAALLKMVRLIVLPVSFYFLVLFGIKVIMEKKGKQAALKALPVILVAAWAGFTGSSSQVLLTGEIAARYLLAVPGILLTCYGLFLQIPQLREEEETSTAWNVKVTIGTFLVYGFLSGLIVPEAAFFPASIFNTRAFFSSTGIPVQLARTACAVISFFTITRILKVFEWESINSLREARDKLEERVRERTEALRRTNDQLLGTIDDLKLAQSALQESEGRLALAQKAGHVGVFDWDLISGKIVWSEQLEELFGLTPDVFEGDYESWMKRVAPEDVQRLNTFFREWLQSGKEEEHWEYLFPGPGGGMRWMESRGRMIANTPGHPQRIIGVSVDVTDRKRAEEQITALNEELKRHVAQLQAANAELEAFSYSVSHDLRAPLRHLNGFIEMLNKRTAKGLDEKSKHYLDVISASSNQMGRLIDDLLGFSRAGRVEMKREEMDSNTLAREVIAELSDETRGRNVVWEIKTLPRVVGDPALLRLVWTNLISNALKFTRGRSRSIIEIEAEERGKDYVFHVKDNGVGFDMKYKHKLFGLFQRLHRPEEFEGTGVGLANVQRIVRRHGGSVWAEGVLGEGATFSFSLPKQRRQKTWSN
jgi:PAS domain S-box-containing protein